LKKQRTLISVLILIVFSAQIYSQRADSTKQAELEVILKKCAEYCKKLEHSSLYFVCTEEIIERIYYFLRPTSIGLRPTGLFRQNTFIYDYQLIRKDNKIIERRNLIEENGKKRNEKNAKLKTKRFYSQRSVFGPVGLLSKEWQGQYNYSLMGEDKVDGRKAYVVEAILKERIEERLNYGKIWVDKKDFSILKIEVAEESLRDYDTIREDLKKYNIIPMISDIHFYRTVKNGIRFPSKTIIEEYYKGSFSGGKFKKSRTVVSYDNYRFFIVEVDVKY